MARIDWIEHRLLNWARWTEMPGGGALGYAAVNLGTPNAGRNGYAESVIPVSSVEARETDDAVRALPGDLRYTVTEIYIGRGTLREKLGRLQCAEATMHARIGRAHRQLADHFSARQAKQQVERERVEQLQGRSR